ncbi:uncharacterized protein LOC130666440 [Microplitis mediator]|uniref:uncharacterized protein LOC130666440 n=1 Tax=Microplitis mediator TaxID=375433 RepID=UPI002552769E|nr:uncharacterized protein LOC130666440 [Microplitis mediator]
MELRVTFAAILIFSVGGNVEGHGRLIEPPSRASMWRYGFDTPEDFTDNECYCGGFDRQWHQNQGYCGVCGDPWDVNPPREHETGGKYGNSIIVRKYQTNQLITIRIQLTANHRGYFSFRVCPMTTWGQEVTQDCLNKNILRMENGTARYYPGPGTGTFEAYYKLPSGLMCAQCVLQWRYVTANIWADCGNGTDAVGCGPQEEFRGCADITIGDNYPALALPKTPSYWPEIIEILDYW